MSDFDREQPLTDEEILGMEPDEAIQFLMAREGVSEAEARLMYETISDRAGDQDRSDSA